MVLYDREYSYKKDDRQRASHSQALDGARLLRRYSQERHPVALSQDPRHQEGVCLTSNTIGVIRHTGVRTELCYHLQFAPLSRQFRYVGGDRQQPTATQPQQPREPPRLLATLRLSSADSNPTE